MRTEIPRQIVHLSGLVFVIMAQFTERETTIFYFALITLSLFLYSWYTRSQERKLANFLEKFESKFRDLLFRFERKDVRNPFTGAMFFYLGCTITFILFPLPIASAACAMLAVGDSLSTLIGKKFGKHMIGRKTFEGFMACFLGSLLAGIFFVSPVLSFTGAIASSLTELLPRINDNLTIPVASGLVMFLASMI
ncbi:MAG: diacylglycerol/polyprenol kinase family protein [Candidatus Aenigmarchaeota archaeon]